MSFYAASESRILEAFAEGKFRNLEGEGRPLRISDTEKLAGNDWLGNHVLQAGEALPEWLLLGKDIERQEGVVARLREAFACYTASARETADWQRYAPLLATTLEKFVDEGRALRTLQDRFNFMAPGIHTQRPGFWTSFHVCRMVSSLADAGAPDFVLASFREAG